MPPGTHAWMMALASAKESLEFNRAIAVACVKRRSDSGRLEKMGLPE